jgi:hypothetical protein
MRRLVPDLVGEVTDVRFEHSPGRGHPGFTADNTAFDVLIRCTTPRGRRAFVAIEVKYTEAPGGVASPERPRYDTLSQATRSFRDPDAPAGAHTIAERVADRYLDFGPVHEALIKTFQAVSRRPKRYPRTPVATLHSFQTKEARRSRWASGEL